MKKILLIISILSIILLISCTSNIHNNEDIDYKQSMRDFVERISEYSKNINPNFIIIPQNGHNLITKNGEIDSIVDADYLNAIDGLGREDLFYGYSKDNLKTQSTETFSMIAFMNLAKEHNITILVTDYCFDTTFVDDSYNQNNNLGYISFAADSRGLDTIPTYPSKPYNVNNRDITSLSDAKNFLYLINPGLYDDKKDYLDALRLTDYDVLIIDLFFNDGSILTSDEIESLKTKASGGTRLVIAYMSIGEAEDYRYYWQSDWLNNPPSWLVEENPNWEGNYKVKYWQDDWQNIILGSEESYLDKIINANFDGVYLDIIDAFEYFEN